MCVKGSSIQRESTWRPDISIVYPLFSKQDVDSLHFTVTFFNNVIVCVRSSRSTTNNNEVATAAAIGRHDAINTSSPEDSTHFEAFEYQDVADVADNVKNAFDDLTGVSPLWFSVENDGGDGTGGRSFGGKRDGRSGREMFGDWVVEDSLIDVFEKESPAGSDKQVCAKTSLDTFKCGRTQGDKAVTMRVESSRSNTTKLLPCV